MKIIKILFSGGCLGKNIGCEKAPDAIVADIKSQYLNEEGVKPVFSIETVLVENSNIEKTNQIIFESIKQNDEFPIILGGDHSITYSCFKAFATKFPEAGLIVFDAHPDLMPDVKEPTHEGYLRKLIDEGTLYAGNVILVGLRSMDNEEQRFIKEKRIRCFSAKNIFKEPIADAVDAVMGIAKDFSALYVSIDIDVLDPAFAPGTGYIEPGGLSTRELLYFIQRLRFLKNLKAADIVEANPDKECLLTIRAASKIAMEFF